MYPTAFIFYREVSYGAGAGAAMDGDGDGDGAWQRALREGSV